MRQVTVIIVDAFLIIKESIIYIMWSWIVLSRCENFWNDFQWINQTILFWRKLIELMTNSFILFLHFLVILCHEIRVEVWFFCDEFASRFLVFLIYKYLLCSVYLFVIYALMNEFVRRFDIFFFESSIFFYFFFCVFVWFFRSKNNSIKDYFSWLYVTLADERIQLKNADEEMQAIKT